ncbi:MAG: hypothetical protein HFG54_03565 [Lachnospiraceae bacterium]|jgi:hypothetical protein|nr:hypothetical protein [Lachnospiraceae bacterium]
MRIRVNVKRVGKRRNSVEEKVCLIDGCPKSVRELIVLVVDSQVREYNQRLFKSREEFGEHSGLLRCMTRGEIEEQSQSGKIGFGESYGEREADEKEAQQNAIQCFEDGIYRIFMDGRPLEALDEPLQVTEERVFTFVRLTMLAGRMW